MSMLTKTEEKLIRSLHSKKGRQKNNLCLVEGEKIIEQAKDFIEFTFTREDTDSYEKLVTTETPQYIAAVARIPESSVEDILKSATVIILDGVQDPGNVGAILRLCQAFNASLILVESADPMNPKTIRSSAGASFQTPWISVKKTEIEKIVSDADRSVFRLEKTKGAQNVTALASDDKIMLIAGSEGSGIHLPIEGVSVLIEHAKSLESINVGNAVAIALFARSSS